MTKKIIFLLVLMAHTSIYGMKRNENNETFAFNDDVMPLITEGICSYHSYNPCVIKNDIRVLSNTNKFFHDYYEKETTNKKLFAYAHTILTQMTEILLIN